MPGRLEAEGRHRGRQGQVIVNGLGDVSDADVRALNGVIDLVTARNGLLPGPDLYAWFSTHPDELGTDGVHPSASGTRSINRLWYEALRPLYSAKP